MKRLLPLVAAAGLAGCNPAPPAAQAPSPTPAPVHAYTQFSPGDTVDLVRTELGLDHFEIRYRRSLPEDQMRAVYFLDDGNLYVDAKKVGHTWVLISTPLLDPSTVPAADRVANWDRGVDPQNPASNSHQ